MKDLNLFPRFSIIVVILCAGLFGIACKAEAGDVVLSWDPPTTNSDGTPLTDLAGFKIYYGTASRTYGTPIDVGNVATYIIPNLVDKVTYFFAVTAYDFYGNESLYSSEVSITVQAAASVAPSWIARYNGSANQNDVGLKAVADGSGNVYVTGWSFNGSNYDYATLKYDPAGTQLWVARYDGGGGDFTPDMVVDGAGNVYVTGWSDNGTNYDIVTIKYDTNGNQLWLARYDNGGNDSGFRILVDGAGNVYVAGNSSNGSNMDFIVVKYDPAGNQLWAARYDNGGNEGINSLALDSLGNVYVTGWSNDSKGVRDYATVKYNANGNRLWAARYNGPANQNDVALKVVIDGSGNVYVTGWSYNGANYDYTTVKYDMRGVQLWATRYDSGRADFAPDLVVDSSGNVYVTGWSNNGVNYDIVTIKYDANGSPLWKMRYDKGGNDAGFRVLVDGSGNVYVGGNSSNGTNDDYLVVKYDPAGNQLWTGRYNNGSSEGISSFALDALGNVYIAGWSNNNKGVRDYAIIRYNPSAP